MTYSITPVTLEEKLKYAQSKARHARRERDQSPTKGLKNYWASVAKQYAKVVREINAQIKEAKDG